MNSANPATPSKSSDYPLPEFFGCPPDEGPERFPEPPWDYLFCITGMILKRWPQKDPRPIDDQLRRFLQLWFTVPLDEWGKALTAFLKHPEFWGTSPHLAWEAVLFSLHPESAASTDQVKPKAIQKEKKHAPPSREFLLLLSRFKTAPNPQLYERVFLTIHAHCFNKLSKKGKKVYPYGQAHIAKITGLPIRTIERIWAWLKRRGIINKAWNENPEAHHHSGWYVCTSLKQVGWYRDPRNRRRQTTPRSA